MARLLAFSVQSDELSTPQHDHCCWRRFHSATTLPFPDLYAGNESTNLLCNWLSALLRSVNPTIAAINWSNMIKNNEPIKICNKPKRFLYAPIKPKHI